MLNRKSIKGASLRQVLMIMLGIALLLGAGLSIQASYRLVRASEPTEGTIIGFNAYGLQPEVKFDLGNEGSVVFHQRDFVFGYRLNDPVRVLYDPNRPGQAGIDGFAALWLPSILMIVLALVLLFASREPPE